MSDTRITSEQPLGWGGAAILMVLFGVLLLTVVVSMTAWTSAGDGQMSIHGWIALGLGTFFSLAIGCGLMALMFYSSRSGYDDVVVVHVKNANDLRDKG
jgi:hypothetical protein